MHKRWLPPSLCFFVANFISVLVCLMRCVSDIKTATREAVFRVKVSISAEGICIHMHVNPKSHLVCQGTIFNQETNSVF